MDIFKEELLSRQLQRLVPKTTCILRELHLLLIDKFGDLNEFLERWIRGLEEAASTRRGGTRYRFEALVDIFTYIYSGIKYKHFLWLISFRAQSNAYFERVIYIYITLYSTIDILLY